MWSPITQEEFVRMKQEQQLSRHEQLLRQAKGSQKLSYGGRMNLKHLYKIIAVLVLLSLASAWANPTASYRADVATEWYSLTLNLIQETPGFSPPVASRALGYMGVTLYESVVPGMEGYQSLLGQLNGLKNLPQAKGEYYWPMVANTAMAEMARQLFPASSQAKIQALEQQLEQRLQYEYKYPVYVNREVFKHSVRLGRSMVSAIGAWARTDGGHEGWIYPQFPRKLPVP